MFKNVVTVNAKYVYCCRYRGSNLQNSYYYLSLSPSPAYISQIQKQTFPDLLAFITKEDNLVVNTHHSCSYLAN